MIPLLLLLRVALAGPPEVYALSAELQLPEAGPVVIDLAAVQTYPHRDDLLLLDATGREVPWALLGSWQDEAGGSARVPIDPVGGPPRADRVRIDTRKLGRGIHRIELDVAPARGVLGALFGSSRWAMEVSVLDAQGREVARELLWRAEVGGATREHTHITVPDLPPGVYELVSSGAMRWDRATVHWRAAVVVPSVELDLAVSGPVPARPGVSDYTVALPAAGLEVEHLDLEVADPRFLRRVEVLSVGYAGAQGISLSTHGATTLERVELGNSHVSHTRVELGAIPLGDQLLLQVDDGRDPPLQITGARATLQGRRLLVQDAGPGPHRLYAAPSLPDGRLHDLAHVSAELLRADPPLVTPAGWEDNPAYNPASTLPESLLRGAPADVRAYRKARALSGPGVGRAVRWRLPVELVGAEDAPTYALRVVDAEGLQVPFLVEELGLRRLEATVSRREEPGRTRLSVSLTVPTAVSLVRLRAGDAVFERELSVGGAPAETWRSTPDDPDPLHEVETWGRTQDAVEIVLNNGDDQPLGPIEVELYGPVVSLVAVDPGPGARLLYAGPLEFAEHDLLLVATQVLTGVIAEGAVGPEVALTRASALDRRVGLGLVAALALGLVVVAFRLLREPPEPPDPR